MPLSPAVEKPLTGSWLTISPRDEKLLLLAGGLNPDNVRMAIEAVHPDGVDVSSGVENDDGAGKNAEKIHDFVAAVKS